MLLKCIYYICLKYDHMTRNFPASMAARWSLTAIVGDVTPRKIERNTR